MPEVRDCTRMGLDMEGFKEEPLMLVDVQLEGERAGVGQPGKL